MFLSRNLPFSQSPTHKRSKGKHWDLLHITYILRYNLTSYLLTSSIEIPINELSGISLTINELSIQHLTG